MSGRPCWQIISFDDRLLVAGLIRTGTTPQSKALSEGFISGLALLNQGPTWRPEPV
jgi:hypothetical protein